MLEHAVDDAGDGVAGAQTFNGSTRQQHFLGEDGDDHARAGGEVELGDDQGWPLIELKACRASVGVAAHRCMKDVADAFQAYGRSSVIGGENFERMALGDEFAFVEQEEARAESQGFVGAVGDVENRDGFSGLDTADLVDQGVSAGEVEG